MVFLQSRFYLPSNDQRSDGDRLMSGHPGHPGPPGHPARPLSRARRAYHYTLDASKIANANASDLQGLITSRFSNVVYRQDEVQSDFLVLLLIVVIGTSFPSLSS